MPLHCEHVLRLDMERLFDSNIDMLNPFGLDQLPQCFPNTATLKICLAVRTGVNLRTSKLIKAYDYSERYQYLLESFCRLFMRCSKLRTVLVSSKLPQVSLISDLADIRRKNPALHRIAILDGDYEKEDNDW